MRTGRAVSVFGVTGLVLAAFGAVPAAAGGFDPSSGPDRSIFTARPWDLNGDGRPELVVPTPNARVDGLPGNGAVAVFTSSATGPVTPGVRVDEGLPWVPGVPEGEDEEDQFGSAVVSADFDVDGYADMAICTESEPDGPNAATGLTVVFGGWGGPSEAIAVEQSDGHTPCFGLAAADVDSDGAADLVLGSDENVMLVRGGSELRQPDGWVFEEFGEDLDFAWNVQTADFDGDGHAELVHSMSKGVNKGACILPGTDWDRQLACHENDDVTGIEIAVGDLDGDGRDDLVLGEGSLWSDGDTTGGRVKVWYGSEDEDLLASAPDEVITQDTPGVPGTNEPDDYFGVSVSIADTDGDGCGDLAIGVPQEGHGPDPVEEPGTGRVVIVPGGEGGLRFEQSTQLDQASEGVPGTMEIGDTFGHTVAHRTVGFADDPVLLVGSPGEDDNRGRVHVFGNGKVWQLWPEDAGISPDWARFGRFS